MKEWQIALAPGHTQALARVKRDASVIVIVDDIVGVVAGVVLRRIRN